MQAGLMNEVIAIEKATRTKDNYGAWKTEWTVVISKAHARVTYGKGGTTTASGDTAATGSVTFQMRYTDKVEHGMRITWGDRHYLITTDPQRYRQRGEIDVTADLIDE